MSETIEQNSVNELLETILSKAMFPVKAVNSLKANDIVKIKDMISLTEEELLTFHGIGVLTLEKIKVTLANLGLKLNDGTNKKLIECDWKNSFIKWRQEPQIASRFKLRKEIINNDDYFMQYFKEKPIKIEPELIKTPVKSVEEIQSEEAEKILVHEFTKLCNTLILKEINILKEILLKREYEIRLEDAIQKSRLLLSSTLDLANLELLEQYNARFFKSK